jgi:large subunit ribosomal protein L25
VVSPLDARKGVMSEVLTLQAQARDPQKNKGTGTRVARRLRRAGQIPAIVYGHKQAPVPIAVPREEIARLVKRAGHLAELKIGDQTEMVLVKDVQYDYLGKEIIHLDFARVSADETIHTQVRLELHGTPPGTSEGGVLEFLVHSLDVSCLARAIPDSIRIEVGGLHVGDGVHVRDLVLPEGVTATADPDLLLVHVVTRHAAPEPTAAPTEAAAGEPEVIGRKAEEKADEKDEKKKEK